VAVVRELESQSDFKFTSIYLSTQISHPEYRHTQNIVLCPLRAVD
jgi:hypothetical protein